MVLVHANVGSDRTKDTVIGLKQLKIQPMDIKDRYNYWF